MWTFVGLVLLQIYSLAIITLDFCFMVLRGLWMWAGVFYRTLFPSPFKPINGKIVLV